MLDTLWPDSGFQVGGGSVVRVAIWVRKGLHLLVQEGASFTHEEGVIYWT